MDVGRAWGLHTVSASGLQMGRTLWTCAGFQDSHVFYVSEQLHIKSYFPN